MPKNEDNINENASTGLRNLNTVPKSQRGKISMACSIKKCKYRRGRAS